MATILHLVNKSPFSSRIMENCLAVFKSGDGLVLLSDGVHAVMKSNPYSERMTALSPYYAIEADLKARAIPYQPNSKAMHCISYDELVQLCTQYDAIQSWY